MPRKEANMGPNTKTRKVAVHFPAAMRLRTAGLRRVAAGLLPVAQAATESSGKALKTEAMRRLLGATLVLSLQTGQLAFTSESAADVIAMPIVSCEREIATAARRYDIPLAVFYAVGLNETGSKGRLQPFSMNIDGRAAMNGSLDDALRTFREAQANGARMIDIGCMQINHHYHAAHFASLVAMFDPAQNVDYAAKFLRDLKVREKSWTMAVARYNAGPDNNPAQKRYVCAVLAKMVGSGFGEWTDKARAFCHPSVSANMSH
jgi:soluble lytic murein transglycosylase-like protein